MKSNYNERLLKIIPEVNKRYFKQIFVYEYKFGNSIRIFSERYKVPYINLNLEMSHLLKDIPKDRRTYKIADVLNQIINSYQENIICIDYYELLFDPVLSINVFDLFKNASRNKTLIIAWRGTISEDHFIHAKPGHPEYKKILHMM